jgi:hypothetical protein
MTQALPLPAGLEEEMQAQENDRRHVPAARSVLERAVVAQLQAIADGLLAHRLLSGQTLDDRAWVAQFLSRSSPDIAGQWGTLETPQRQADGKPDDASAMREFATAFLARHPADIEDYKRDFHLRVARGDIRRITPAELRELPIRIFGDRVPIWREGRINAQFAMLGSDLRLFVAAADQLRALGVLRGLGHAPAEGNGSMPSPMVFLLGRTRASTSLFKAQLFEFDHEFAVSPYLHATSPGLVDQCRVVMRHRFWHGILFNYPPGMLADGLAEGIIGGHEFGHVINTYGTVRPGHFSSWRSVMRSDLCRFAQRPVKYGEFYVAFHRTFDRFESAPELAMGLLPPDESREGLKLIDLLTELVDDGVLERSADGTYVCRRYEEGRAWSIQ